jgi:dihydrofolate reductase
MGGIHVHEFMTLDGVVDDPMWTADYGFDPKIGEALGGFMGNCQGILLGRTTYEGFAQSWPDRTADDDPAAPFFNDTTKYVVSSTLSDEDAETTWRNSKVIGPYDPRGDRHFEDGGRW